MNLFALGVNELLLASHWEFMSCAWTYSSLSTAKQKAQLTR